MNIEPLLEKYRTLLKEKFNEPIIISVKIQNNVSLHKNGVCHSTSMPEWGWNIGQFDVYGKNKAPISQFSLRELPNCCGVIVSSGVYVNYPYRGRGAGTLLHQLRIEIAKALEYSTMLCSDVLHNTVQRKILRKNGWKDVYQFRNIRSGNEVVLSVLNLLDAKEK